jgi:phage baseplate assembly protein W
MPETQSYSDIDRLFRSNDRGDIRFNSGGQTLVQRFLNRLLTKRGERLHRPNFGSELHLKIQDPLDQQTVAFIELEIMKIDQEEQFINVQNVEFDIDEDDQRINTFITLSAPALTKAQKVGLSFGADGSTEVLNNG